MEGLKVSIYDSNKEVYSFEQKIQLMVPKVYPI